MRCGWSRCWIRRRCSRRGGGSGRRRGRGPRRRRRGCAASWRRWRRGWRSCVTWASAPHGRFTRTVARSRPGTRGSGVELPGGEGEGGVDQGGVDGPVGDEQDGTAGGGGEQFGG